MAYSAAIFDMDGTILNTLEDLWSSVNYALELHGMPKKSHEETRRNLGNGMEFLIRHSVPAHTPESLTRQILTEFKAYYADHCTQATAPYLGIYELLDALHAQNIRCAVVSNKGDFAVQELVKQYFPGRFDIAVGERESVRRKPAPDMVQAALKSFGLTPADCVYIGDSEVDIDTAHNTGCNCIVVGWGFRDHDFLLEHGAPRIVNDTTALLQAILS